MVVVLPPDAIGEWSTGAATAVAGGSTRSESVRAGLAAVPDHAAVICVHDAARPLATTALFRRVIAAVGAGADGAVPAVPVADTIKIVGADDVVSFHAGPGDARGRADPAGVPRRRPADGPRQR